MTYTTLSYDNPPVAMPSGLEIVRYTSLTEVLDDDPDLEHAINSFLQTEKE